MHNITSNMIKVTP